jgi:CRISPR-associated protein Cas1
MTTRWRIIDFTEFSGDIKAGTGRVKADNQAIPLADVGCILLGPDTRWSGELMALAASMDVIVLGCDWRGIPHSATAPWSHNSRVGARHQAQARMSAPRKKNAWMRITRAKILGQASNLPPGPGRERLVDLARSVRSGDPENIEARASRTYWSRMFPGEQFHRDPGSDGRNSLLNYGYAIVRGLTLRSVTAAGLAPALSVFHSNRANPFSLVDDLMEPFRPAVDHTVGSMPRGATLADGKVKKELVEVLQQPMRGAGETVLSSITSLVQGYAIYAENQSERLEVPSWLAPDG